MDENKSKALVSALRQMERQGGKGSIRLRCENEVSQDSFAFRGMGYFRVKLKAEYSLPIAHNRKGRVFRISQSDKAGWHLLNLISMTHPYRGGGGQISK